MGKDKLEDLFNEQLHSYQSPIDTDALWDNISPSVDTKSSNRRSFIYIFIGAALVLPLCLCVINCVFSTDKIISLPTEKPLKVKYGQKFDSKLDDIQGNSNKSAIDDRYSLVKEKLDEDYNVINLKEKSFYNTQKQETKIKSNTFSSKKIIEKPIDLYTTIKSNQNSILGDKKEHARTQHSIDISQKNNAIAANFTSEVIPDIEKSDSSFFKNKSADKNLFIASLSQRDKIVRKPLQEDMLKYFVQPLDRRMSISDQMLLSNLYIIESSNKNSRFNSDSLVKKGFAVGIQLLPFYSKSLFNTKGVLSSLEYMKVRSTTEKYMEAFTIRALGQYQWNSGFYTQIGIDYGQIDERFTYYTSTFDTIKGKVPLSIYILDDGTLDSLYGEGLLSRHSYTNAKVYNYHRFIDLTIGFGYEMLIKRNLSAYIDGNVGFNLMSWHKGTILSYERDIENWQDKSLYKKRLGLKWSANLGLRVTRGAVRYSFGPSIVYHASNWLDDSNSLEHRYVKLGLHFGVNYSF